MATTSMQFGQSTINVVLNEGQLPAKLSTDATGNTVLVGADRRFPLRSAEVRGASPSATAAVNTAAIQAAINAGGSFHIATPGEYLVNGTLTISNDIEIWLADGVIIKQADGTGKSVIATSAATAADIVVSSATSAGSVGTYNTAAAHGLAVGDYVLVYGATVHGFSGVFEVLSIPTTTQFTAQLAFAPLITTAAGSMNMRKGVGRVSIYGGTIDYNNANNNSSGGTNADAIVMAGVHTLNVDRKRIINSEKYALYVAGCQHVNIGTVDFDTDSDGLHLLGPTYDVAIGKLLGRTGDNMLALSTFDGSWSATLPFIGSHDKIVCNAVSPEITDAAPIRMFGAHVGADITVSAITKAHPAVVTTSAAHGLNNGELVWFNAAAGMTQILDQLCIVDDVTSTTFRARGINSTAYNTFTSGTIQRVDQFKFHDVTLNNVTPGQHPSGTNINVLELLVETGGLDAVVVDSLRLNNASGSDAIDGSFVKFNAANPGVMYVGMFAVNGANVTLPPGGALGDFTFLSISRNVSAGRAQLIEEVCINSSIINGRDRDEFPRCVYIAGAGVTRRIKFNGSKVQSLHSAVQFNPSGGPPTVPEIYFDSTTLSNCQQAVSTIVSAKVFANNLVGENMLYGVVRSATSGAVIELDSGPLNWKGTAGDKTPIDVIAPATGRANGSNIKVDVSTLTAAAIGDTVYNTNAAFGAGAGIYVRGPTAWIAQNPKRGTAVLVGGTVTVSDTSVTADSRILLTSQVDGGTVGFLRVSARTAGTSFVITSSSATDTSTVAYEINEPD